MPGFPRFGAGAFLKNPPNGRDGVNQDVDVLDCLDGLRIDGVAAAWAFLSCIWYVSIASACAFRVRLDKSVFLRRQGLRKVLEVSGLRGAGARAEGRELQRYGATSKSGQGFKQPHW